MNGELIYAGNPELLSENGIFTEKEVREKAESYLQEGCTVIYLGKIRHLHRLFWRSSDTLRPDAQTTVDRIKETGIVPVLLTGDHENAAHAIARQIHIDEVHANCLPEDKLHWIDTFQNNRRPVCMIGDGIKRCSLP